METKLELLTPLQARMITLPVVYALCTLNGEIFYIGKTKNANNRFRTYMTPKNCHSSLIAGKIAKSGGFMVKILDWNPSDLSNAELQRIKQFEGKTVNIVNIGNLQFKPMGASPWSAGIGTSTPSSFLMNNLKMNLHSPQLSKKLRKIIQNMDDARRCVFELEVFQTLHPIAQNLMRPWFDATAPRMIQAMEANHAKN